MPKKNISYIFSIGLFFLVIILGAKNIKPFSSLVACLFTFFTILTLLSFPLKNLSFKIGTFLGDISYSLYVCHLPIYYFLYSILTKYFETDIFYSRIYWLMIPFAIAFSYFAYILVEKRSLIYIKKIKANNFQK